MKCAKKERERDTKIKHHSAFEFIFKKFLNVSSSPNTFFHTLKKRHEMKRENNVQKHIAAIKLLICLIKVKCKAFDFSFSCECVCVYFKSCCVPCSGFCCGIAAVVVVGERRGIVVRC